MVETPDTVCWLFFSLSDENNENFILNTSLSAPMSRFSSLTRQMLSKEREFLKRKKCTRYMLFRNYCGLRDN